MAPVHERSQFARLMEKNLTQVAVQAYQDIPNQRAILYNVGVSDKAWEEYYSIGDVPDPQEFTGQLVYLSIPPEYHTKIEHKEFAAGLQFERKLLDDAQYRTFENNAKMLGAAMARKMEKDAISEFSGAFTTAFTFMTKEEGKSLCSSSHTTKSGTSTSVGFDNTITSALSKTALGAARLQMRQFRSSISERIDMTPDTVIVPEALEDTAREILESRLDPDTANNTINPQYGRYKLIVVPRLDDYDSNNWFLADYRKLRENNLFLLRTKPEFNSTVDFDTFILKFSVYSRYSCGWIDWRWILGAQVS